MKRVLLLVALWGLPVVAQASVGEDINNLLDRFFGNGKEKTQEAEKAEKTPVLKVPKIEIPKEPTEKDLVELREQIMLEETELQQWEEGITQQQEKLWTTQEQRQTLEDQIFLLDEGIGLATKKAERMEEQGKKWKENMEILTRKKSILEADIRVRERELERIVYKKFVQKETLGTERQLSILDWLFSRKSVSKIIEEKRRTQWAAQKKKGEVASQKALKQQLETQERQMAYLLGRVEALAMQAATERKSLNDLAQAKANLRARAEQSMGKLEEALQQHRTRQAELTVTLQNLRQGLEEAQGNEVQPSKKEAEVDIKTFFGVPLRGALKITAKFRDAEYQRTLGRRHDGTDLYAPQGSDVLAMADGTVEKVMTNGYQFSYVIVRHKHGFYTVYGHVSKVLVTPGQTVKQGEVIAKSGGTPGTLGAGYFTTGPHLEVQLFRNNQYLDAMKYLPPDSRLGYK